MGFRHFAAARLLTPALAVLLLAAAPSSRTESPDLGPTHAADPVKALDIGLPYGEGLLSTTAWLTSEVYRGIERFRPLSVPIAVAALGSLLAGLSSRSSPVTLHASPSSASPPRRIAGPRAPPLQLA
jgi:hypothetical protein